MMLSFSRSRSGMALLNVIMLMILIGAMVIAGYKLVAPLVQRGKVNDTKTTIKSDVDAIISWTVTNCRIPDALGGATDFIKVAQNPNDAWGNRLAYLYAPELADSTKSCNQICGLPSTTLSVDGVSDVAFVILSSQYSDKFHHDSPTSSPILGSAGVSGAVNISALADPPDIVRIVPLNELKARIGCAGYTWGQLRILNNELPNVYTDSYASYGGTMFASGGAPSYTWPLSGFSVSPASGLSITIDQTTGKLTITSAPTAGNYTVTVQVTDQNGTNVQRTYTLKVLTSPSTTGDIPPGTPPDPPVQDPTNPGFNSTDPNLIEFGLDNDNTSACVWYPQNLPLLGKTMRAYWSFCYKASDTSPTSSTYADGYTFALMQASNPTSYCGTGSIFNDISNPYKDCRYSGYLGEFLAYCGLPGQSMAVEFDIYPSTARNDTTGSYNHATIVKTTSSHSGPPLPGTYADNTHNVGGNPANATSCYPPLPACNGSCSGTNSCTGTCDGVAVTGRTCTGVCVGRCAGASCTWATPVAGTTTGLQVNGLCSGTNSCFGTCNGVATANSGTTCTGTCYGACTGSYNGTALPGTGPGSLYNSYCGHNFTVPAGHTATTWLEDGCSVGYDNHNTRVELHTRCNTDCSQCEQNICTTKSLIKVWIDKGNSVLTSNDTTTPDLSYCSDLPTALNQYKVGFTEATGGAHQWGYIKNFSLKSAGACPLATISPSPLPAGTVGIPYSATMSASGGTPPYSNWNWSSSAIPGIATSTLPPGLTISSAGVISGSPTTNGRYNTLLISVDDTCTADNCTNTVARSYTLDIGCSRYQVDNVTGSRYYFRDPQGRCVWVRDGNTITNNLGPGQTISRYSSTNWSCTGAPLGTIGYADAVQADLGGAQNYNDCTVGYGLPDGAVDQ